MKIFNEKTLTNFAFPKVQDKDGYLLKKRTESKRSFKRRYFVLHKNVLPAKIKMIKIPSVQSGTEAEAEVSPIFTSHFHDAHRGLL